MLFSGANQFLAYANHLLESALNGRCRDSLTDLRRIGKEGLDRLVDDYWKEGRHQDYSDQYLRNLRQGVQEK